MNDLIKDVATLTTIPEKALSKLVSKSIICINDSVEEALLTNESIVEINIGIGTLYIQLLDNAINYKFIPSSNLESSVRKTVINKQNILERMIEKTLADRIIKTYKDFL